MTQKLGITINHVFSFSSDELDEIVDALYEVGNDDLANDILGQWMRDEDDDEDDDDDGGCFCGECG